MRIQAIIGLLYLLLAQLNAQEVWVSKGAIISTAPGALIYVSGDLRIDSSSQFFHAGELQLDGSVDLEGILHLEGNVSLQGDIRNEGEITAGNGIFDLRGATQTISGSGKSNFYQLQLSGSDSKYLEQDIEVVELNLNDRILHTGSHTLFVKSNNPQSITRLNGYIRSENGGGLFRNVDAGLDYLFPVGSLFGYSPIIARAKENQDTLGFRFAGNDAGEEGLSRNFIPEEICQTNPLFFITMVRSDTGALDLQFFYPSAHSSQFNTQLSTAMNGVVSWQRRYPFSFASQDTFLQVDLEVHGYNREAFLLGRDRPLRPEISGKDSVCAFEQALYHADSTNGLKWSVGGGDLVEWGAGVSFTSGQPGQAFISVTITDSLGCSSLPSGKTIIVSPLPEIGIGIKYPNYFYEDQVFQFYYIGTGASQFNWYNEGAPAGNDSSIQVSFDGPGTYLISLEVLNAFGCTKQLDTTIVILPGLEFPDSFSPNGDGINDELQFLNSGLLSFNLNIYNRWGNIVFSSSDPKFNWDGRDKNGELVAAGTYFYRLDADIPGHPYRNQGSITVVY